MQNGAPQKGNPKVNPIIVFVVNYYKKKIIPSVCKLFSPVIYQFWLRQLRIFRKKNIHSVCSLGHVEWNAVLTIQPKFFRSFWFSTQQLILCCFSHSTRFLTHFIDIQLDFFSVVAICNGWTQTTKVCFRTSQPTEFLNIFHGLNNLYEEMFLPKKNLNIFGFSKILLC